MFLTEVFDSKYDALAKKFNVELTADAIAMLDAISIIKKECQPFLKQVPSPLGNQSLFRGMKHTNNKPVIKRSVRLHGRSPKDSPEMLHKITNRYFEDTYGGAFRDALFVSGYAGVADNYGTVYRIFPVGDFTFLWSPEIADYLDMIIHYNLSDYDEDPEMHEPDLEHMIDFGMSSYQTTDLVAAIASHNEIMIRCESYYAIRVDSRSKDMLQLMKYLLEN